MFELQGKENNEVKVKITINKQEWEMYLEKAYNQHKDKFNIQGFRKGQAPRKIIEKNYGERVFYDDALDIAFYDEYGAFLTANPDLEIIDQPSLTFEKFDENGVEMTATAPLLPEVKLGDYKGLTVQKYTEELDEAKVEKQLNQERERLARYVEADSNAKASMGDFATINFKGFLGEKQFEGGTAENYRIELGSHTFIDNFEDQIVGMGIGEEKDINVTFPEDYPSEELKGKPVVFKVKLNKLENKQLPELNDEFASNSSEFETLEEYKADIRKHLEESLNEKIKRENENRLLDKCVENTKLDIPNSLIERQLDLFMRDFETRLSYQGLKMDDYLKFTNSDIKTFRESYRDQANKSVKTRLVLEAIIKAEGLDVSDSELDAKLEETAKKYNKSLEEYKKNLNEDNLTYIKNDLLMDKVVDFLTKNNTLA